MPWETFPLSHLLLRLLLISHEQWLRRRSAGLRRTRTPPVSITLCSRGMKTHLRMRQMQLTMLGGTAYEVIFEEVGSPILRSRAPQ
jgi:hypothetical protein